MSKRIASTLLLLGAALCIAPPLQAGVSGIQDAINKAGKQRMLTQKIMGSYAMLGMNFQPEQSTQRLRDSSALFESQLNDLRASPINDAVTQQLEKVATGWASLKPKLDHAPQKEQAAALSQELDALMASANQAVTLITEAAGGGAGEIVNLSGRQRMLSQRMNALYMLRAWGATGFDFEAEFKKAVAEFKQAHTKLAASGLTTPKIKAILERTEKSFIWFERSAIKQSDTYVPALVLRAADRILKEMNDATAQYASL
ncbi:MAG: type IV pili methyl-accepting chemotaxis transducer N-terminal domain-containing protein [Candidatus Sedimenticola endophacoides]